MPTPDDLKKFKGEIEQLIIENKTDIDKKVLVDNNYNYRIGVKKYMMRQKEKFTDDFLKLIAAQIIYPDPTNQNGRLFEMIAFMLRKHSGIYRKYEPVNRLYFLLLANIYCNSIYYMETYPWVPALLSIFEQSGVTGEFRMGSEQYNELFDDCHIKGKIKADLDFAYVYDPSDKTHKPDPRYKNLSNTTIEHVSKSAIPAAGWFLLQPCKYGNACYQTNKEHLSRFSHHTSAAGPSSAGPSAAGPSAAGPSGKIKKTYHSHRNHEPYGGKKRTRRKYRRNTKKRRKTIKRK